MFFYSVVFVMSLVIIDQISKFLAIDHLKGQPSVEAIPNVINFTYVENTGAAFGIFGGNPLILSFVSLVIIIGIIYILVNKKKYFKFERIDVILLLILAGAIGNFIDRFFRRYVVDFIDFDFMNFAVFNLADTFVVIGSILLCIIMIFFEKEQ